MRTAARGPPADFTTMAATPTDVRNLSLTCEFDAYTDEQVQPFLDEAALHMNEAAWNIDTAKPRYDQGHALLAAHLMTLAIRGGGGGAAAKGTVVAESLGPARRQYATPTGSTTGTDAVRIAETGYGTRWQALLDTLPLTPFTAFDGVTGNPYA